MALYKISSSRVNNIEASDFVGGITENGLIWYDEFTGVLRLYNGEPGGQIINDSGNSTPTEIVNGTSNVVVYPDGNVAVSVNGIANVAVFGNAVSTFDNIDTAGNISAEFFIGDGSQLTGIAAALPDQTGQQGKFLSTNGTQPSWQTVAGVFGLTIDGGDAADVSTDLVIDAGGA
jgi:hypothetical protein